MSKFNSLLINAVAAITLTGAALAADMKDMKDMKMSQPAAKEIKSVGVVKAVDAKAGTVTIAHEPIKELKWPAMTMMFKVSKPVMLDKVTTGKKVQFALEEKADNPTIISIETMD